jgi:hypothetical protein
MDLLYYISGRAVKDSEHNLNQKIKEDYLLKKLDEKKIEYLKLSQSFREAYNEYNENNENLIINYK